MNIEGVTTRAVNQAARDLAAMAHSHLVESANKSLKTRRQTFIDNLTYFQADEETWIVSLDASAVWINDGLPAHNMLSDLLNSPKAKQGKNGKYLNIPFDKSPGLGKTGATPAQQDLISTIKAEMKSRGMQFSKIERNQDGTDKLGLIHSFDINNAPTKTGNGPGQGSGPIGAVRQGQTGIPFLSGVRVYQNKMQDKNGNEFTAKNIFTFRVASESQKDRNMWQHPGVPKVDLFNQTAKWIETEWNSSVLPALMSQIKKGL